MKKLYKQLLFYFFPLQLTLLFCLSSHWLFAQCDATTPSFVVDLSDNPDSVWLETNTARLDSCCFQEDADPCITFIVTLPPNVGGLYFSVENPQPAIASSQFHINCDPTPYSVQDTVCVAGYTPPYVITYCKPGNDRPDYIIAGIGSGEVSPPITVSDACTDTIYGTGFKEPTITWTSYPYNSLYQSYLSDSIGEDTVIVTPSGIYPDSLQYIICGEIAGLNCSAGSMVKCDTTTVYFVTNFSVSISPEDPTICFGGGPATLTANASGGASPYSYLWNTGETTQSINVSSGNAGLYWVEVKDTLECAGVRDSVNVTEFFSSIQAFAGTDLTSCLNNPSVNLNGSVQAASGGQWSGGAGTFNPNDSALNAVYTPDSAEIANGIANLILTTTGNGSCPADVDTMQIFIYPDPLVNAGVDQTVCSSTGQVSLSGTVAGFSSSGKWTSNGSGTFFPNDSSLNAGYNITAADISAGTITIFLSSTNNGQCVAVSDSLTITIQGLPVVNAGSDQILCKNNADAVLNGIVSGSSLTGQWLTSGNGSFVPNDSTLNADYIPGAGDTAGIVLVLSSTNNGVCNAVSDSLEIYYTDAPAVDAGPDIAICGDASSINLNGNLQIATGAVWSSLGSGTFSPNDSSLINAYSPSPADTAAGIVEIVLTSTGNGNCLAVTDTVLVTITDVPSVEAGTDQTVCANNATINLNGSVTVAGGGVWTSSGSGTFSNDSLLNTNYQPSNVDTSAGTVTIYLTSTANGSCNAVSDSIQITITDAPVANAGADIYVCKTNPDAVLSGNVSTASGGSWTSSGSGTFSPDANTLNANYLPSAADVANGSVTINLTTTGNALCNAESDNVSIFYTPDSISLNAGNDTTVCSASFTLNGSVEIASGGIWTTTGSGTFSPNDSSLNATYSFSNGDTAAGTVTFILTSTGNGGCASKKDTVDVSIAETISISATAADSVCGDGEPIPVSANSSTASGSWNTLGMGTFIPTDTGLSIAYIPGATDISAGSVSLVFSSSNNNGCAALIDTVVINLVPAPFSDFIADSVCLNNATTFTDATTSIGNIVSWNWNFGDGNSSNSQNTSHNYSADSLYSVLLVTESNYGCIDSIIKMVPVYSLPVTDFATASQCFVDSVFFNNLTTIKNDSVAQWSWDFGDGNSSVQNEPAHLFPSAGTYTISLVATSVFGCKDSISKTLPVQPAPVPFFSNNKTCVNDAISFIDSTTISSGNVISWNWDFGDGNADTVQNPSHNYTNEGTYTVQLVAVSDSGCVDSISKNINVFPTPDADFSSDAQCFKDSVFFNDNSSISSGSLTYNWNFGDNSSSTVQNPGHAYLAAGIYEVILTVSSDSGCSDTISKFISVNPSPLANFSNSTGCFGKATSFSDSTILSSGIIDSWTWDFGDGNADTVQNPSHNYTNEGTFTVQLITVSDSGCVDSISKQINVFPSPTAAFSSTAQCFVDSVFFYDSSFISSGNLTYYWTFGDGSNSTVENPAHFYPSAGLYTVTLIVVSDSSCPDTVSSAVSVNPAPVADFSLNNSCLGNLSNFTDQTTISTGNVNEWQWNFGDGNTYNGQNTNHNYANAGSYTVQLIAVSDSLCRDTIEKQISIHPLPQSGFASSAQCFVDSVFFTDTSVISVGSISQWLWNFGDNSSSTDQNPGHFYSSLGSYSVSLIAISDSGCADTSSQIISVAPAPNADFILSTNTVCLDQSILFADMSTVSPGNIVAWNWNFGDGTSSSSSNAFHSYSSSDTFKIVLIVTSNLGCTDTSSKDVIAYPSPTAGFAPEGYCINEGTIFKDSSFANPDTVVSWQWYLGDGASSFEQDPEHFYPNTGNYGVSLIASTNHGCKDTITKLITINPAPTAVFYPDNYVVLTGDPINFINNSSGSISWEWNFGDSSGTSALQNPQYIYSTGGNFTITLITANEFGCADTAVDSVIINIPPKVPNGFSPNGDGKNDILYPMGGPYKTVEFKIFNSWGELIYLSRNPDEGWNGTRNEVPQPIGVYVYTLFAITEDNKEYNLHGDITLLR